MVRLIPVQGESASLPKKEIQSTVTAHLIARSAAINWSRGFKANYSKEEDPMYLPTSLEGMNSAIGQYIHSLVAAKIANDLAADAARRATPGYVEEKFVWDVKTAPKRKKTNAEAFNDFVTMVRARKEGKRNG